MRHLVLMISLLSLGILLAASDGFAVDLRILDSGDTTVEIRAAYVDYTVTAFGTAFNDIESNGIRIAGGQGRITVPWERIAEINVTEGKKGEIVPKTSSATAVEFVGLPMIRGDTELGHFTIGLVGVKTIVPIPQMKEFPPAGGRPMSAEVTDTKGTVIQLKRDVSSVRMNLGVGLVAVRPELLGELTVTQVEQNGKVTGKLVLRDGRTISAATFPDYSTLKGETDLGKFEIRLVNVRTVVFREPSER